MLGIVIVNKVLLVTGEGVAMLVHVILGRTVTGLAGDTEFRDVRFNLMGVERSVLDHWSCDNEGR